MSQSSCTLLMRFAAVVATSAVLVAPRAAHAHDTYGSYLDYSAAHPGSLVYDATALAANGVTFTPSGTLLGAGAANNRFGSSALLFTFTAGDVISVDIAERVRSFGFFYETSGFLRASIFGAACTVDNGDDACDIEGAGFFGAGHTALGDAFGVEFGPITLTAVRDGELVVGNFTSSVSTVPEPGTVILLGSGIAALAGFGLSRRRRAVPEA